MCHLRADEVATIKQFHDDELCRHGRHQRCRRRQHVDHAHHSRERQQRPHDHRRPGPSRLPSKTNTTTTAADTSTTAVPDTSVLDTSVAGTSDTSVPAPTTTVVPGATTTTVAGNPTNTLPDVPPESTGYVSARGGSICKVGPSGGTGEVFQDDATARIISGSGWGVTVSLRGGSSGEGVWNVLASECYNATATCPTRQLAIVLDGEVISAPTVQQPSFTGSVEITGSFSEKEARNLARVLNSGSLPVKLVTQDVKTVSPTLGKDSLHAAVISGLVGIGLVLLFMALYYRLLGLIVAAGLTVSGALIWTMVSFLSKTQGLALSLAGIAGLIVSVGVTVDSYVVFFERLKDEVRAGRSMRNSAQRGFAGAWHTIVVADLVSLIGAAVLWYLSVGDVRGFAFFLGLSTLCDLVVAYFFTRPAVLLLARTEWMARRKVMGIEVSATGRYGMSTEVLPNVRKCAAAPAVGCTTARPPSTSTVAAGGVSADPALLLVITIVSMFASGLNLGLDFKGGVSWEVPAAHLTTTQAKAVLDANGVDSTNAKIQELSSASGSQILVQVGDQPVAKREQIREALATAAKVDAVSVSVKAVGSTWGRSITEKAIRALIIFLILVSLFIAWRLEWRMALAAIIAMIHDVLISVGVYSVFRFEVTPATVVAFLTILGFSLYDTIVVFDKVKDNTQHYSDVAHAVRRRHQRVDEPGADALDQHQPRRRAARAVAADPRCGRARRSHPARVRPGAAWSDC